MRECSDVIWEGWIVGLARVREEIRVEREGCSAVVEVRIERDGGSLERRNFNLLTRRENV